MIHTSSSSSIHNLMVDNAKKMSRSHHQQQHHLGFNFKLMGCSASDVVNPQHKTMYYKLDQGSATRSGGGGGGGGGGGCSGSTNVPKGCLAVYVGVGEERQRYIIRAHLLNHPVFRALLDQSASEFGFRHTGGLKFACETEQFEQLLLLVKNGRSAYKDSGSKPSSGLS